MTDLICLLNEMLNQRASDLHLTIGAPPKFRVDGKVISSSCPPLNNEEIKGMLYGLLNEGQKAKLESEMELDFSFGINGLSRFRANIFFQRGAIAAAIRSIPCYIPSFEELGIPPVVTKLCERPRGLILVTGPTGSGKSTTLAAMIEWINNNQHKHIITIEDPIEYLHTHKKSIVNQREVHADTYSFKNALRSVLREDPDIVLIGEMRDLETIEAALTISETGHLTFATLHTNSCVQSINRIIDVFPPHQQNQIRTQLSFVLEGILAQQLIPKQLEEGRALAIEVLIPNAAVRNQIRENQIHHIYSIMQAGQAKHGMQTMNQALFNLFDKRIISKENAIGHSLYTEELINIIQNTHVKTI
ncbi:type IV pilus twitching motility protein PilT [bacterium]|nr:type IV pilus twitching motility protein PilT [bacterium]